MPQLLAPKSKSPALAASYAQLREKVRETLLEGQQKIEEAKVQTYWQTGKYIHEHILHYQDRAGYGEQVTLRLSEDLKIDFSVLRKIRKFYRLFQKGAAWPLLGWGHYRALLAVEDETKRSKLADAASKNTWPVRQLEIEVRNHNWSKRILAADDGKPVKLPPVTLGPFHTYKIIRPETVHHDERTLLLDMGFSMKKEMSLFPGSRYPAETIVTSVKDSKGNYSVVKAKGAAEDSLYTYKAYVVKVIDGDTLKVDFRLGFGDRKGETIRLNHIDCPEINTPEGRAAKKFVESQLSGLEFITVKSVKTRKEKWGRYLGDVFLPVRDPVSEKISKSSRAVFEAKAENDKVSTNAARRKGDEHFSPLSIVHRPQKKNLKTMDHGPSAMDSMIYLNQLLLDKGYAVRIRM